MFKTGLDTLNSTVQVKNVQVAFKKLVCQALHGKILCKTAE